MDMSELAKMSPAELLNAGGEIWQMAIEKMIQTQMEAKLPEIATQMEAAHASYCLSELAKEKGQVQTLLEQEARLKADLDSLRQQLGECHTEQDRLKEETTQQEKQLQELRRAEEAHVRERKGYLSACKEEISRILPFIRTETYEAYVNSLYNWDHIIRIYEKMKEDWRRGDTTSLELCKQLIDDFIELYRRIKNKDTLHLQQVKPNDLFDPDRFDKTSGSPETGEIFDIIYYGLEEGGAVIDGCRSLVEVK